MSKDDRDREQHRALSRRKALGHLGIIGGIAGAGAYAALAPPNWPGSLSDPDGERGKPIEIAHRLPEGGFAVAPSKMAADLGVARGTRVDAMVRSAVDAIGGIRRFVSSGDTVVIKPNVAFGRAAALGATTQPRCARGASFASSKKVAPRRFASRTIPSNRQKTASRAAESAPQRSMPVPVSFCRAPAPSRIFTSPGRRGSKSGPFFWQPFRGADKVIGVSPVKDHNLCRASMTTKKLVRAARRAPQPVSPGHPRHHRRPSR